MVFPDEAGTGRDWTRDTSCGARHVMTDGAGMGSNRSSKKLATAENQQTHYSLPHDRIDIQYYWTPRVCVRFQPLDDQIRSNIC